MRKTWRTINNIIGRGKKQLSQSKFKDECGNCYTNPKDVSNRFNDFFVNIGPKLASNIQCTGKKYFDYLQDTNTSNMYMKPIVDMDIIKIFNQNKSAGCDNR